MKKTYSAPVVKTMHAFTGRVMDMELTSDGTYEPGVGGDGSDKEARTQELELF